MTLMAPLDSDSTSFSNRSSRFIHGVPLGARLPMFSSTVAWAPLTDGRYFTPSGRARLVPVTPVLPDSTGKLVANSGRLRDQWHTMTRTGRVPKLSRHRDFFSVSLSPADAHAAQLSEDNLVTVENVQGKVNGLVRIDEGLPPGQVFTPIHWSGQFASAGTVSELYPSLTDPHSGQPQSKFAPVELKAVDTSLWGLLFSREEINLQGLLYWSRIAVEGGFLYLLAEHANASVVADRLLAQFSLAGTSKIAYQDLQQQDLRELYFQSDKLVHALFLNGRRNPLPAQEWMVGLGSEQPGSSPHRLLAGCTPGVEDAGALVCSCWEVSENAIRSAIGQGADSVEALGEKLRCGTQCGSCIPELRQLLAQEQKDCAA